MVSLQLRLTVPLNQLYFQKMKVLKLFCQQVLRRICSYICLFARIVKKIKVIESNLSKAANQWIK